MSRRLLQRGRYPKAPAVEQITNNSSQGPQTLTQCPVTSEIPGYPPVQSQPTQNMWSQSHYPNPGTYQSNQVPTTSNPSGYWSTTQMYPTQIQQPTEPWNWTAENNSGNSSFPTNHQQHDPNFQQHQQPNLNYQQQHPDPTYQQPYLQQQPEHNYPQQQHLNSNYQHQQVDPSYQQIDSNYQQHVQLDPIYQQHQQIDPNSHNHQQIDPNFQHHQKLEPNYQYINPNSQQHQQPDLSFQKHHQPDSNFHDQQQSDPNILKQPDLNHQHQQVDPSNQMAQPQIEHPTYAWKDVNTSEHDTTCSKPNAIEPFNESLDQTANNLVSYDGWDETSLSITQPEELPWTYSNPQYSNPTTNATGFPTNYVPTNVPFNLSSLGPEDPTPLSYLSSDSNVLNGAVDELSNMPESHVLNESKDDSDSSNVNDFDTSSIVRDLGVEAEFGSTSLSAFFQNSDPIHSGYNSDYGGASTPDVKNVLDSYSLDEKLSHLQINESGRSSVPTEDEQDAQNLEDTDDCGNQEINFFQEENVNLNVDGVEMKASPAGFVEEPINQEVPEPNIDETLNSPSQVAQVNKDYHEMSPEEPFNQQIPVGSGDKSRSTSSERVVIRPREESPFKPPRMNGASKGTVVQQEIAVLNSVESKASEDKTIVQEVNLETFPDNLERPPDYEELRKQSSFYVSHQKHLRTDLNSSPSSLLCDNPDIPCVTLAPAAPPIHSSSKSDKSESSTDSRREMAAYDKSASFRNNLKESNTSSPARVDSVLSEKSLSSGRSHPSSTKETNDRKPARSINKLPNTSVLNSQSEQLSSEPNYSHPSNLHIKESRIKDIKSLENYPKAMPSMENYPKPVPSIENHSKVSSNIDNYPKPVSSMDNYPKQVSTSMDNYPKPISSMENYPTSAPSMENYPKPSHSMENLQNPNNSLDYSSRHSDYSTLRPRTDPRYAQHEADYSRQKFADRKYPSFDERQYYSDRERSRPSSRTSLDDRSEDYRYPHKQRDPRDYPYMPNDDRRYAHPDYDRPPSRVSESDMRRPDRHGQYDNYYKQQHPYSGQQYSKNQDYYQKPPAYRGYDYDPYQRDPYYASYYDAYRQAQAYSNYNYGFYDELYGNDPRYRQYQEQYRQYYAKYGYDKDYERSSAHSGRSSANELAKDMSSIQYPDHDNMSSNASEISAYNIRQDYSYDDVPNDISVSAADQSSTPSARLTPVKFPYAHPIARFSPGGILITAIPSQVDSTLSARVKIQTMQAIMENEDSYQELKSHQGPLIRGLTHKNDVIEFCNQKIKDLRTKEDVVDRDSYILLWELSILMLRQNGSIVGSDIAELLLNDHEVLRPHPVPLRHTIETPQSEQSPAEVNDSSSQSHAGDTSSPDEGIVVLHDKSSLNTPKTVDMDKVTRKFREFLLFGHKKDALEWAIKHGLWGHALFLASKLDLRTYANVMTRFANSLVLNDPLQTLYQLMSGRQPSAVTCVADKKWGDWRPHLAMILSNPSGLPDVDSRSITTLGDTLASRGCLPAAHFCYIMAQVEFGTFEDKSSKMVLLSADHRLPFEEFATNEAIQCTEIYEYAQSLANPVYSLIHLQMYKFIYALRLVEHGFLEEALHYCEDISTRLLTHPVLYTYDLITEVYKLASQLKYHDPHFFRGHGEFEDQDDPDWLKNLADLVQNYNNLLQEQNSQIQYEQTSESIQTPNETISPPIDNISFQNVSQPSVQTEMSNSMNSTNFYQPNNWNQQATSPNATNLSNNQQDMHPYYQNDQQQQQYNSQSTFQFESSIPSHEENETTDVPSSPITQTPPFDYYSGSTQQVSDTKQPSYDQVNSYGTTNTRRERRDSAMSSGSRYSGSSLSVARKPSIKEAPKPDPKKETKPSSQAGKTWLGGIFSRLLPKAPNQMILPDDKNPTIVWDESTQRWVNKDSNDEDETNAPLAPPTDMELMGTQSSDMPTVPPGNSMPPTATSPINKFSRPKTRGMRQNYVDVLNNSGATTKANVPPEALFPTPYEQPASTSMFVPPSVSNISENSSELESTNTFNNSGIETEEKSQGLSGPLMFDPAEFDSRRSSMPSQRHTIGRTGRRTYPT